MRLRAWKVAGVTGILCLVICGALWFDIRLWVASKKSYELIHQNEVNAIQVLLSAKDVLARWPNAYLSKFILSVGGYSQTLQILATLSERLAPVLNDGTLSQVLSDLQHGDFHYLVLLQNDEELRATGGFIGSFVTVDLHNGQLAPLTLTDIYAPAGQLTDFVPPPAGVREYLSSGKGWGLPDANWSPDFPTSARTVLDFMVKAKYPSYRGVIAVNTQVFAQILTITGPIYLPDQKQEVTSQNFTQVLRADRQTFFAGSYQKVNVLKQLSSRLQAKIADLSLSQKIRLFHILFDQIEQQNILAYSTIPAEQKIFELLKVDGHLPQPAANSLFLAPVESNVGINKINPYIKRQTELDLRHPNQAKLTITFTNTHPQQSYIDYFRLFISPETEVTELKMNNQSAVATSSAQLGTNEIGFLAPVAPLQTATISATLSPISGSSWESLSVLKQKGLPASNWKILLPKREISSLIENQMIIPLSD